VAADYAKYVAAGLEGIEYVAKDIAADNMVAGIEANKADIAAADLITLGYGNAGIIDFVLDNLGEDYDWSEFVGAEYAAYVDEAIETVKAELAKNGIDGAVADKVINAVEGYAYAYATLLCAYPEAVDAIKAINPDAQIIIVGMHNPLAGLVVEVEGVEVAVGDYVDYIIAASNAYYFGYALLTGNAIYVDAPDAEIGVEAGTYTLDEVLKILMGRTDLYPTDNGNKYIAEQILNAMNITKAEAILWGDADDNGIVDTNDATVVLKYCADMDVKINLEASNVDGEYGVDTNDATLILKYCAEMLPAFPVEE